MQEAYSQSPEEKIRRTIAEYCHFTDTGDFDSWVNLFVEDGSFHMFGQSHTGHRELRAFIEDDQPPHRRGLHLTTDSVIRFSGDRAEVCSNFIFIASGDTAGLVAAGGDIMTFSSPQASDGCSRNGKPSCSLRRQHHPGAPRGSRTRILFRGLR